MTARAPTRKSAVLVVEDEELLRLHVDGFLEEAGFEVTTLLTQTPPSTSWRAGQTCASCSRIFRCRAD